MTTYDALRDLHLVVEDVSFDRHEAATSSGFDRVTTIVELSGDGVTGRGEDVTYESDHHDALLDAGPWNLSGAYSLHEFSSVVGGMDLFPDDPDRPVFRNYRRWAVESAALDLALRQADTTLGGMLDIEPVDPYFVVSTTLVDHPDRVENLLDAAPGLAFKLDPTDEWTDDLIRDLAATDAVRVLDMKDRYDDADFTDQNPAALYDRVLDAFPDAIVEDPRVDPDTRERLTAERHRLAWDAPIHGVADVDALPWPPEWLNVKPSRFGSVEALCSFLDHADSQGIDLYGGGQFELDVGRTQIQELAALFYPDGPNDVAPVAYHDPGVPEDPPAPPIGLPDDRVGFGWDAA